MTNDLLDSSRKICSARRRSRASTGRSTSCDRLACGSTAPILRYAASKRRLDRRVTAENPDLTLFGLGRGTEPHLAVADQHQSGRPGIGIDGEDRSFDERELEILGLDDEVSRIELSGAVQRQPVEILDARKAFLIGDPPAAVARRVRSRAARWRPWLSTPYSANTSTINRKNTPSDAGARERAAVRVPESRRGWRRSSSSVVKAVARLAVR